MRKRILVDTRARAFVHFRMRMQRRLCVSTHMRACLRACMRGRYKFSHLMMILPPLVRGGGGGQTWRRWEVNVRVHACMPTYVRP